MTKNNVELITKLGPKGQIVLRKEIRRAVGMKPGSIVAETVRDNEVVIRLVKEDEIVGRVRVLAKNVGKTWPKGKTSVEIVNEQRR